MLFCLRAAFWILVVAAFTPPSFHMAENSPMKGLILSAVEAPGHQTIEGVIAASEDTSSRVCGGYGEVCTVTAQLGSFAGLVGDIAVNRVESWAASQRAPND